MCVRVRVRVCLRVCVCARARMCVCGGGGGGGEGVLIDYCPSEATHFMRSCWFTAYNIRLESLLPAMQELLCFSQICSSPADRHT